MPKFGKVNLDLNKSIIGYGFQYVLKAIEFGLNRLVFVQINVSYAQQRLIVMALRILLLKL